ncbi:MAG: DNA primase, partial [Acidimicrobiales bacterium]
ARDRTVASAYSVRAVPNARVSAPLLPDEVADAELDDFTVSNVPARYAAIGDPAAGADGLAASLEPLLDLARRDEEGGLGDAPWPPHFPKQPGEGRRARPSVARLPPDGGKLSK